MRLPLLALIVIPIAELLLLFEVAGRIGAIPTLLLVIVTAFIGLTVLKIQGFNTLSRARLRVQGGQLPGQEIIEGMLLAFAGAMLLTPGFITDILGFCCLTPAIRRRIARRVLSSGSAFFVGGFTAHSRFTRPGQGYTVEGERADEESEKPRSLDDDRR